MKFRVPDVWIPKLWRPRERCSIRGSVVTVLCAPSIKVAGTFVKKRRTVPNAVSDAGDLYYAQRAALLTAGTPPSPLPSNFTDANGEPDMVMELYKSVSATPVKSGTRASLTGGVITAAASIGQMETGYPKVNDSDPDNTGAGVDVVTYLCAYSTSEANDPATDDVIITNPGPGASEPILMWADGLELSKTASDTAKVFVNHQFNGSGAG